MKEILNLLMITYNDNTIYDIMKIEKKMKKSQKLTEEDE